MQGLQIPTSNGSQTNMVASVATAALPSSGQSANGMFAGNDFQQSMEVELKFTRANNGAVGKVVIIKGAGLKGTFADNNQVGTTFSSADWSDVDNWLDYCNKVGMYADGIRFDTDDTANYIYSIFMGQRMPNGQVKGKKTNLSKYRQIAGGGYANTAEFTDNAKYLVINHMCTMELSGLKPGTSFSIFLNIVGAEFFPFISEIKY